MKSLLKLAEKLKEPAKDGIYSCIITPSKTAELVLTFDDNLLYKQRKFSKI